MQRSGQERGHERHENAELLLSQRSLDLRSQVDPQAVRAFETDEGNRRADSFGDDQPGEHPRGFVPRTEPGRDGCDEVHQ